MLDEILKAKLWLQNQQEKVKSDPMPVFNKFRMLRSLDQDAFGKKLPSFMNPTDIKLDADLFDHCCKKFNKYFVSWKNEETKQIYENQYALPLVNKTGQLDLDDVSIGNLEDINRAVNYYITLENDFLIPTEVLDDPVFSVLNNFKQHMLRSSIKRWEVGANETPRTDMVMPTTFIQFWAFDKPQNLTIRYEDNFDLVEQVNIEPHRLYAVNTNLVYDKVCTSDSFLQLSITTSIDIFNAINIIESTYNV